MHQLHLKYGPILRLMPNELSFIDPEAWRDIYGHRQGHPQFHKDRTYWALSFTFISLLPGLTV